MEHAQRHRGTTTRPRVLIAAVALAVGGFSSSILFVNAASAASSHKAKTIVVSTSQNAQLGTILVSGKTLYTLKAGKTSCGTNCVKIWPELLLPKGATKAKAGAGVNAAKLGTVKRSNGALQVTYAGKPLYWFVGDKAAGQAHGNLTDTWGKWSVFVTAKPTMSTSTSSTGSGGSNAGTGGVSF
jgi:predicted lipoprotein with Yx(FWY)xxD motif